MRHQSTIFNHEWICTNHTRSYALAVAMLMLIISQSVLASSPSINSSELRIVSAGGSITEILFALDLQERIVAVDTSSSFPETAQAKPKVGYYRQLGTEGVLSLKPTHLFAVDGVGPESVVQQLQSVGVAVSIFDHPRTLEGLLALITQIGEQTEREIYAADLVGQINDEVLTLHKVNSHQQVTFLMSANERGLMAAGSNTVPNLIMELLGLKNPFSAMEGFKPISSEALLASNTQVVFMPAHQTRGLSAEAICALPALTQWANMQGCNIEIVDSLLFLGLTPRLVQAAQIMAARLNTEHAD